jgi:phage shock protein E
MLLGTVLGALAGYLYYHQVGCNGGTCPITSRPFNSTLFGAVMGGLLLSTFKKDK